MKILCDKCNKDISNDYCKLSYKIIDAKGKTITFKGNLCRKCLGKEETKISKADTVIRVSETVSLHIKNKKHYKGKRS